MSASSAIVLLAICTLAAPAAARSSSLVLPPALEAIVERRAAQSPALRDALDRVDALTGSRLTVVQREMPTQSVRARSVLSVARDGGFRVSGEVILPPGVSEIEIAALLAHELGHVLTMAGQLARDPRDRRGERSARRLEDRVRAELRLRPRAIRGTTPTT